ncbi:hypothetical protein MNV49_002145 [Pseudohyphozyma bogoriensis]|nr:hypothetical protein MNV49_002145 [Pseudohyphozyma bogoriensis]
MDSLPTPTSSMGEKRARDASSESEGPAHATTHLTRDSKKPKGAARKSCNTGYAGRYVRVSPTVSDDDDDDDDDAMDFVDDAAEQTAVQLVDSDVEIAMGPSPTPEIKSTPLLSPAASIPPSTATRPLPPATSGATLIAPRGAARKSASTSRPASTSTTSTLSLSPYPLPELKISPSPSTLLPSPSASTSTSASTSRTHLARPMSRSLSAASHTSSSSASSTLTSVTGSITTRTSRRHVASTSSTTRLHPRSSKSAALAPDVTYSPAPSTGSLGSAKRSGSTADVSTIPKLSWDTDLVHAVATTERDGGSEWETTEEESEAEVVTAQSRKRKISKRTFAQTSVEGWESRKELYDGLDVGTCTCSIDISMRIQALHVLTMDLGPNSDKPQDLDLTATITSPDHPNAAFTTMKYPQRFVQLPSRRGPSLQPSVSKVTPLTTSFIPEDPHDISLTVAPFLYTPAIRSISLVLTARRGLFVWTTSVPLVMDGRLRSSGIERLAATEFARSGASLDDSLGFTLSWSCKEVYERGGGPPRQQAELSLTRLIERLDLARARREEETPGIPDAVAGPTLVTMRRRARAALKKSATENVSVSSLRNGPFYKTFSMLPYKRGEAFEDVDALMQERLVAAADAKLDKTNLSHNARLVLKAHTRWAKANVGIPAFTFELECWTFYSGFIKEHGLSRDVGSFLRTLVTHGILTGGQWDELWDESSPKWK